MTVIPAAGSEPIKEQTDIYIWRKYPLIKLSVYGHIAILLLRIGSDYHTGSLFPGQDNPDEGNSTVIAVTAHYQDRPTRRVSMTPGVFNNVARVVFLISGETKAVALKKVLYGPYDPLNLPAQRGAALACSFARFVDSAAAAELPGGKE